MKSVESFSNLITIPLVLPRGKNDLFWFHKITKNANKDYHVRSFKIDLQLFTSAEFLYTYKLKPKTAPAAKVFNVTRTNQKSPTYRPKNIKNDITHTTNKLLCTNNILTAAVAVSIE